MLLNFGLPTGTPTVTVAPKSNIDIDAILGLKPSQYEGLKSVGDTDYFYGDNKMYKKYTPSPSSNSYQIGYYPIYGYQTPSQPSYETLKVGNQNFRTVDVDVPGFVKTKREEPADNYYTYRPSMAYVYSNMPKPTYTQQQLNNVTSFLSAPTAPANMYDGVSHGAGRFLNAGSLLPAIDYSSPQTVSSSA